MVALTRLEKARLKGTYLVPDRKLTVIGWGVNAPTQTRTETPRQAVQVLCVGRLGDHKGQMWLLETYLMARPSFHRPVRLVLVGRDEGGETGIRTAVRRLELEEEVVITGELNDEELDRWYVESDVFALFSRYEAFGLVFFEAMASGLPVLTHDVGANRELLTRGSVVVPPFHQKAAAAALVRLVNDEDWRQNLGSEGKAYALAEFTWPVVARRYLDLYESA